MTTAQTTRQKPVTETLLELAYLLHTTKVVAVRPKPAPRHPALRRRRPIKVSALAG